MIRFILAAVLAVVAANGCGKKAASNSQPDSSPPPGPAPAPANTGSGGPTVVPGGGVGVVTNPNAALGGGGGGGGVMQVRKAAKRAATQNELNQIRLFIENASGASGQMPTPQVTLAALEQEAPPIAAAVKEGVIVLHPARTREDVWAYEAAALEQGGQVVTGGGIERMDAATLKARIGR